MIGMMRIDGYMHIFEIMFKAAIKSIGEII